MQTKEEAKDKWELALDEMLKKLKQCQEKHSVDSCMKCSKVIGCEVRKEYVNAVYESMNKGSGGGFEF